MSWKVRHQGSPKSVENLTLNQVVEGLQDGMWEPTDEVMGPGDSQWVAIESHPKLEEIAADIEPPPPRIDPDETRLDMTPLIDVCLVLLIFMVLTISYGAIQKQLEAAQVATDKATGKPKIEKNWSKIKDRTILVKATMEGEVPVIRVEDKVVSEANLADELTRLSAAKPELLIVWSPGVRRKTIVAIQDAATKANVSKMIVQAKTE